MRYRVLVIGFGSIGERHARCFLATDRCGVSVCEINQELRERARSQYGINQLFVDLDSAMQQHYDSAVIATPAHLHIPMALRLASAGVNLLIEKPLSVSLQGLGDLHRTVRENGVAVMVGYTNRSNPALASMRQHLQSGRFGRPLQVVGVVGQDFAKYRPAYPSTYFAHHESGGGAIQDAMTHLVNAAEWLVGPIRYVMADAAHMALQGVDVEDTVHLIARHDNEVGTMGLYGLNLHQKPDELTITINAESGTLRLDLMKNRWSSKTSADGPWEHHDYEVANRDQLYINQAATFLDAVEGQIPVTCTLEEAEQSLRVNLAMLQCVDKSPWVHVNPATSDTTRQAGEIAKPVVVKQPRLREPATRAAKGA